MRNNEVFMKKILFSILSALMLLSLVGPLHSARANSAPAMKILSASPDKVDPALKARLNSLQDSEMVTVIVTLRQQADLSRVIGANRAARQQGVLRALQVTADSRQNRLKGLLNTRRVQGLVASYQSFWVFNGFSVTATVEVINELAQDRDVFSISSDELQIVPAFGPAEPNISVVNAPALWSMGFSGQGVVVANMDSGVDVYHPDLSARWRGGSNSWFDPYGQHPATPTDLSGHGTQTMGIMIGGDAGGTTVGVAPNAQWIAVKIFNDSGTSTATAIHQGFQWLLDPDGNPDTADAPNVVNNSWTYANPGCYLDFEPDLQSLRAAGILPVFAAGNGGPYANTSYSPSNNPSAFAVGAINNNNLIYSLSSRGPTTCGGSSGPFPEIVAPGVYINTTDLYGFYYAASGTSMAAPHVTGGLALLLSAYPNLSVSQQEDALRYSAVDLGIAGPDDTYGYGRLNLLAAYQWLAGAPAATATSMPTFTFTAMPNTPTALPTNTTIPASPTPLPTFTSVPATSTPLPTFTSIPATSTPLPTLTATSAPTASPTKTPAPTFHIGDLDRSSAKGTSTTWRATVTIKVHNANEQPISGVTVSIMWTNGAAGTATCTTNSSGNCTITKSGLSNSITSVTLTVTNATKSSFMYTASANHDPDGESTGTVIVVTKP
jgi:subtilisin family serine protease